jgi:hypothetical protein
MARMASGKATGARSVPGKCTKAEPVIALRPESRNGMQPVVDFTPSKELEGSPGPVFPVAWRALTAAGLS